MPKNVSSSPTIKNHEDSPPDAKFFWRDWRNYCANTGHLFVVIARRQDLLMGEIVGFLNYEHAIVEFSDEIDGVSPTQIVDLTATGATLFKEKSQAEFWIKIMNENPIKP